MIDATMRVPVALWHQFHAACLAHHTIPSDVLCEAMEDALERWEAAAHLADINRLTDSTAPFPWTPNRLTE